MQTENDSAAPMRFSTDAIPAHDRMAFWREIVCRVLLRLDIEPLGGAPLLASFEQHTWSSVALRFVDTNPVRISRTRDLICDGNGDYSLTLRVEGSGYEFLSNGVTEALSGDDAALFFHGAATTIRYPGACRAIVMSVERKAFAAAVGQLEDQPVRRILPASWPVLRLLNDYTSLLRSAGPGRNPVVAHRVGQHLIDLVALALNPSRETHERTGPGAVREARLATIQSDVLANLSQARLSAKTIGQRHGISDRYIHLLFEETGQTFGRFVEEERLKRAYAMLIDPAFAKMRISDIALKVGMVELSTFNRAFRRRFGETPRGVRRNQSEHLIDNGGDGGGVE